jgi:hypothetical protein
MPDLDTEFGREEEKCERLGHEVPAAIDGTGK